MGQASALFCQQGRLRAVVCVTPIIVCAFNLRVHLYSSLVVCTYPWICVRPWQFCVWVTGFRACLCEGLARMCLWGGCVST